MECLTQSDQQNGNRFAVLTRARAEGPYFLSFVEWYISIGFDKLYIVQNDDEPLLSSDSKCVEIVRDTRNIDPDELFNVHLENIRRQNYDWLLVVDMDEYLIFNENFANNSILQFVHNIELANKRRFDVIQFRWSMAEIVETKGLTLSIYQYFQQSWLMKNEHLKSMFRVAKTRKISGPHKPLLKDETNISVYYDGSVTNEIWSTQYLDINSYKHSMLLHLHTRSLANLMTKSLLTSLKHKRISTTKEMDLISLIQKPTDPSTFKNFTNIIGDKAILPLVHSSGFDPITGLNHSQYLRTILVHSPICNQTAENALFTQAICSLYRKKRSKSYCLKIVQTFNAVHGPFLKAAYKDRGVRYMK